MSHFALSDNWLRQSQELNEYEWHGCFAWELKAVKAKMHYTKTWYKYQLLISMGRHYHLWLQQRKAVNQQHRPSQVFLSLMCMALLHENTNISLRNKFWGKCQKQTWKLLNMYLPREAMQLPTVCIREYQKRDCMLSSVVLSRKRSPGYRTSRL